MEPREFRYRPLLMGRDFILAAGITAPPGFAARYDFELLGPAEFLITWGCLAVALTLPMAWARWRSFIRIDVSGVSRFRSRSRAVAVIPWVDVEEVSCLGKQGIRVRGAGREIRITENYQWTSEARELVFDRAVPLIRMRLESRALEGGAVSFRVPRSAVVAHLGYLAVLAVLAALTTIMVAMIIRWRLFGLALCGLFLVPAVWKVRREVRWLGGRVLLGREGVLVRPLDGQTWIGWEDLTATSWVEGGMQLRRQSGKAVFIPSSLGNLAVLHELLSERAGAAPL